MIIIIITKNDRFFAAVQAVRLRTAHRMAPFPWQHSRTSAASARRRLTPYKTVSSPGRIRSQSRTRFPTRSRPRTRPRLPLRAKSGRRAPPGGGSGASADGGAGRVGPDQSGAGGGAAGGWEGGRGAAGSPPDKGGREGKSQRAEREAEERSGRPLSLPVEPGRGSWVPPALRSGNDDVCHSQGYHQVLPAANVSCVSARVAAAERLAAMRGRARQSSGNEVL